MNNQMATQAIPQHSHPATGTVATGTKGASGKAVGKRIAPVFRQGAVTSFEPVGTSPGAFFSTTANLGSYCDTVSSMGPVNGKSCNYFV